MKKIYYFLLLAIFAGCGSSSETTTIDNSKYNSSYLALGDSYTIGEAVPESERWPVQLRNALNDRGFKVAPPKIIAKTGWTTGDLIQGINTQLNVQRDFDLVSILIGVNDQYQGIRIGEYENQLREIFRKAIDHCKTREKGVFAVSIPDYSVTPFGKEKAGEIRKEIDEFNEVFRRVADDYNVAFYNITPISRDAANDPELIASDDLHPSGMMYRFWVQKIVDEVAAKLPSEQKN